MPIEKWREWLELIALITVVASLLALIFELRQTQVSLRSQAYQARAFDGIAWNMELAKDASLRDMQDRFGDADFDAASLGPSEWAIAYRLITTVRIDLDNEHYQYHAGFLDESFYIGGSCHPGKNSRPKWIAYWQRIESRNSSDCYWPESAAQAF